MQPEGCTSFYVVKRLNLYVLEVVVSTEADSVPNTDVESTLINLSVNILCLARPIVVREITDVSDEANLWRYCVCDTRVDTNTERVDVIYIFRETAYVNKTVAKTTVSECSEVTSLEECVTNVRIYSKRVSHNLSTSGITCALYHSLYGTVVLVVSETEPDSDCPILTEVVTYLRSECKVVCLLVNRNTVLLNCSLVSCETYFTTNPNLCVCANCDNCSSKCHKNLFHFL